MRRRWNPVSLGVGLIATLVGFLLWGDHLGWFTIDARAIWGCIILAVGATIVITALDFRKGPRDRPGPAPLE